MDKLDLRPIWSTLSAYVLLLLKSLWLDLLDLLDLKV